MALISRRRFAQPVPWLGVRGRNVGLVATAAVEDPGGQAFSVAVSPWRHAVNFCSGVNFLSPEEFPWRLERRLRLVTVGIEPCFGKHSSMLRFLPPV
jgi:hypothetical protein